MRSHRIVAAAACIVAAGVSRAALGGLVGPTPYVQASDSPYNSVDFSAGYFHLEDFEDNVLSVPGVSASAGAPTGPGGLSDSVDADDGAIDGNGTNGRDWFSSPGSAGVSFTFDADALGALPTHAGIVWTDGEGTISFEAFDAAGVSLGTIGPFSEAGVVPDATFTGGTAEDRFFGADNATGISRIFISNTAGGIELDHLQFGNPQIAPPPPPPPPPPGVIPLPAGVWAGMAMFAVAGAARRRMKSRGS